MNNISIEISNNNLNYIDNQCLNNGYSYKSILEEMIKIFKEQKDAKNEESVIEIQNFDNEQEKDFNSSSRKKRKQS